MKLNQKWTISLLRFLNPQKIGEDRLFFILTLITGMASGVIAVIIHWSVKFLTELIKSNQTFSWTTFGWGGLFVLISGYITTRHYPSTQGSGIPMVRVALAVYNGKITFSQWLAKLGTSILSLSSGLSLGREGPTVTVCAGIGSSLGNMLHLSKRKIKSLVAIGSAGGLAAAFNTPIAAVVFTLEEVIGDLNANKMLGSIVISSVIAAVVASMLHGNHPTFSAVSYQLKDPRELGTYLFVGILAAVLGPLWVKSVLRLRLFNQKLFKGHKLTIIMVTFFLMAIISQYNTDVLGSGHEVINDALLSKIFNWKTLIILFSLKFVCTTLCYSSGISGGLFMPTLFMGAMMGGLVGSLASYYFPSMTANTGAYALVGMGSFFVAVIRAPFTSIIMIFEMTHDYKIILPLMIANVVSYVLSSKFHEGSIYENISEQDGVHLPTREDHEVLGSLIIEEAMVREVKTLNAHLTVREAFKIIKETPDITGYPVLKHGNLIGIISTGDIANKYADRKSEEQIEVFCQKRMISIYPDQSLMVAFHKLKEHHVSRLPVVSRINDKRLVGIITAEDIVCQFGYHIHHEGEEKNQDLVLRSIEEKLEQELEEEEKKNTLESDGQTSST